MLRNGLYTRFSRYRINNAVSSSYIGGMVGEGDALADDDGLVLYDGETDRLTLPDGDTEGLTLIDTLGETEGLTEGETLIETLLDGLTDADADAEPDTLAEGLIDLLALDEGDLLAD